MRRTTSGPSIVRIRSRTTSRRPTSRSATRGAETTRRSRARRAPQPAASATPIGKCCKVAPPVLVYDQAGNLVKSWGGPGQGYDWPDSNHGITVDHRRQRLAGRKRAEGHADPEVRRRREVPVSDRQARRPQRQQRHRELLAADEDLGRRVGERGLHRRRLRQSPRHRASTSTPASTSGTGAPTATSRAMSECPRTDPKGTPSKQFNTVHCAIVSNDGFVYVCDRVNDRIQVFRKDGTFVKEAFIDTAHVPIGLGVGHDVLARSAADLHLSWPTAWTRRSTSCCAARSRC